MKTYRAKDGNIYEVQDDDTAQSRKEGWVAERLHVSPRTVQGWRQRGDGPPFLKLPGGLVRYRVCDVERWIDDRTIFP